MKKKCKICQREMKGRPDKIFCSAQCKNHYHVKLRSVTKDAASQIDVILHRNRSILLEIIGKNGIQKKVPRIVLENKKFRHKYHTHFHVNSQGKMFRYVYDLAWMEFSDDEILIIRKRESTSP